ncbi:MAG: hypothetical protein WBM04_13670 [Candidatus Korobacteraceae bacterium]
MMPDASVQELKAEVEQIDRQIEQERKRHAEALRAILRAMQGLRQTAVCALDLPGKRAGHALSLGQQV